MGDFLQYSIVMVIYRSVTKGLGVENWMRLQNSSHPLARNEPKGVHGLDCLHPVLDDILIFSLARLPKWGFSTPIGQNPGTFGSKACHPFHSRGS